MARKIYALRDSKNSASFILEGKGGVRVRYNFSGGSVLQNIPATFISENQYCQTLLEASDLFKKGVIYCKQVVLTDDEKKVSENRKLDEVLGVSTASQAINYIADKFGEKVVSGREAVQFGASHGFCFPELKLK